MEIENKSNANEKITEIIKTNFIFGKNSDEAIIKKEISPVAFLKGESSNKTRNIINSLNNYDMSKYSEKEYIFEESKEEAKKIIKDIDINNKKEDILEIIYRAISYDNTSRFILSKALKKLYDYGFKEDYIKLIKEYRMVISEEDIEFNNNYEIKGLFISKNEEELKNYLIDILNILVILYGENNKNIEKKTIKYKLERGILYYVEDENLNHENIYKFAKIYEKIKFTKKYYFNQPIEYETNNILYYNKIINMIFDCFLYETQTDKSLCFNILDEKIINIVNLKGFINEILIKQLYNNGFTKELDFCLKFFLYAIDTRFRYINNKIKDNFILKSNDNLLDKKYVNNYFSKKGKNKMFDEYIINEDNFIIIKDNKKLVFDYNKYNKSILDNIFELRRFDFIEQEKYKNIFLENFQKENFFSEKEIKYMKKLLFHIINSQFFQELIQLFSENDILPNNILKNNKIQDYIINNIIFLPYKRDQFYTLAETFYHNAQIAVSGYPYDSNLYTNNEIYHLMELARKIIDVIHEYIHSIKRYLNICTNGIISSDTFNNLGENEEAGYLFELYLFGWRNEKYKNFKKLFVNRESNKNLTDGYIDVSTAINILNPDLYENDINTIRNILYKNNDDKCKEFNKEIKNVDLINFLSEMGFNTKEKISELKKDKSKIFASRYNSNFNKIFARTKCGTKHKK